MSLMARERPILIEARGSAVTAVLSNSHGDGDQLLKVEIGKTKVPAAADRRAAIGGAVIPISICCGRRGRNEAKNSQPAGGWRLVLTGDRQAGSHDIPSGAAPTPGVAVLLRSGACGLAVWQSLEALLLSNNVLYRRFYKNTALILLFCSTPAPTNVSPRLKPATANPSGNNAV